MRVARLLSSRFCSLSATLALATALSLPVLAQPGPAPAPTAAGTEPQPAPPPAAAEATAPPAAQPPPWYGQPGEQPPPGYGAPPGQQPPPGYGAPPGYPGYAPPAAYGPEEMDYEEGMTIPPGYERESQIRKGLVIAGAVTFGTTWLFSVITGAVAMDLADEGAIDISKGAAGTLIIPVAGPFVAIATYHATDSSGGMALLLLDGLAQAGGVAMLVIGLAVQRDVLVRTGGVQWTAAPMVGRSGGGLGLLGAF